MRTIAVVIAVLAVAACGEGPSPAETSPSHDLARPSVGYESHDAEAPQSLGRGAGGSVAAVAPASPPAPDAPLSDALTSAASVASTAPAMVIRSGSASVEVDSLEPAIAAVRRLVARVGGYVGNTSLQAGNESMRSATLELRVPAERFDEVVAGLSPVGDVDFVNVTAEDVGEQYVDLEARADNARRLEARLVELLAARTGKLADVLAVERELSRVREEIERLDGRMRWLRTRTAMSSLSVSMHEPGPIVGRPGDHPIGDALRQAWRNAVTFVAWLIAASGVLIPLAVLAGIGVSLWRRFLPRRRPEPEPAA